VGQYTVSEESGAVLDGPRDGGGSSRDGGGSSRDGGGSSRDGGGCSRDGAALANMKRWWL
jgi:hypothetical protein